MTYPQKSVMRNMALCGAVAGLGVLLSACDSRPQMQMEEDWQNRQTRPSQYEQQERAPFAPGPEAQEQVPIAPAPDHEAPTWPNEPGE